MRDLKITLEFVDDVDAENAVTVEASVKDGKATIGPGHLYRQELLFLAWVLDMAMDIDKPGRKEELTAARRSLREES